MRLVAMLAESAVANDAPLGRPDALERDHEVESPGAAGRGRAGRRNYMCRLCGAAKRGHECAAVGEGAHEKQERRTYRCSRCGQAKRGHVCAYADATAALPDAVLERVLSWLPANDLAAHAPAVCRRWRRVASSPELWRPRDVAAAARQGALGSLWAIAASQPRFARLRLWRAPLPSLEAINPLLPALEVLDVAPGAALGPDSASALRERAQGLMVLRLPADADDALLTGAAPGLRTLRLLAAPASRVTDAAVAALARYADRLCELDLAGVPGLTSAALEALAEAPAHGLREVLAVVRAGTDAMVPERVAQACAALPALRLLDLRSPCRTITVAAQLAIRRAVAAAAPWVFVRIESLIDGGDF